MFFKRLIIFIKRMCIKKMYIALLLSLIMLTAIYKLLPEQKQTTDIKAGICFEADSDYSTSIVNRLMNKNSIYTFYLAPDKEELLKDVKSGYAECGFYIPDTFFDDYIRGIVSDNKVVCYTVPSSTLAPAITETVFNIIYRVCSEEILLFSSDMHEYNKELSDSFDDYLSSDDIFKLSDTISGEFKYEDIVFRINIPVYEISLILILFSALLGLLIFMQDNERNIYIALNGSERFCIETANILAALIPIFLTSMITNLYMYNSIKKILFICVFTLATYVFSLLIGLITKKSTHLNKVLPLIMLISVAGIFVLNLK